MDLPLSGCVGGGGFGLRCEMDGDGCVGGAPAPDGNALVLLEHHVIGEDGWKAEWLGHQRGGAEADGDEKKGAKGYHVGGRVALEGSSSGANGSRCG